MDFSTSSSCTEKKAIDMKKTQPRPSRESKEIERVKPRTTTGLPDTPKISIRLSPEQPQLETKPDATTKFYVDFVLDSEGPITFFVDGTILDPSAHQEAFHGDFSFVNVKDGTVYGPSISEAVRILNRNDYEVSYANAHRFLTLYTGVPQRLQRTLRLDPRFESEPMRVGESYQIKLRSSSELRHLWWAKGRKWQVLRWSGWPFGKPHNIYDFICIGKERDKLGPVQFSCDDKCIITAIK